MTDTSNATGGRTAGLDRAPAELLDVRAVAALLNCSTRHVIRLADGRQMPQPVRLGNLVRWSRSAVLDWIGGGCRSDEKGGPRHD